VIDMKLPNFNTASMMGDDNACHPTLHGSTSFSRAVADVCRRAAETRIIYNPAI
jgi:hypothetical protein